MEGVNELNPIKKFSVLRKTLLNDLPLGSMTSVCGVTRSNAMLSGAGLRLLTVCLGHREHCFLNLFRASLVASPPYSFRGTLPTASWTFYPQLPMDTPEPLDNISLRQHRKAPSCSEELTGALGRKKMFLMILAKFDPCDKLIWLNLILVHEIVTRNSVPDHSPCLLGNVIWCSRVIGRRACWVLACSSLTGCVSVLSVPILLHGLQWGGSRSVVGTVNSSIVQWLQRGDQAFMWTSLSYIPSTNTSSAFSISGRTAEPSLSPKSRTDLTDLRMNIIVYSTGSLLLPGSYIVHICNQRHFGTRCGGKTWALGKPCGTSPTSLSPSGKSFYTTYWRHSFSSLHDLKWRDILEK